MNQAYYLHLFEQAAAGLDKKRLHQKQIELATGVYLESVVLKLYKRAWANQTPDLLTAPSRIFFSIWINDKAIKEKRLLYNIHAFKLRQLDGYRLTSRQFADDFRKGFKKTSSAWPNVSTDYGPLTLMEGWVKLDAATLQETILQIAGQFLEIDYLIDELLLKYRK